MPYTHITFPQLRAQVADRLGDSSKIFWTDSELIVLVSEAMRTFGFLSGFWRARGTFATVANTPFYALTTSLLDTSSVAILGYSVTDRDLVQSLQYHLLETTSSQSAWAGTEMFTLDELRYSLQRRRDQFLSETGIRPERVTISGTTDSAGRISLADTYIDIRRAAWIDTPTGAYSNIWREDEWGLDAADAGWLTTPGIPTAYSILAPPPITVQLAPIPSAAGTLDLIVNLTGPNLDPATSATIINIPDDASPAIKWGALADLLSMDGPARDLPRAAYCEQRYRQLVELARMMPSFVHAYIGTTSILPVTLQEMDASTPGWQNQTPGTPTDIVLVGPNLVALSPPPDGVYTVTMDVVQKSPINSAEASVQEFSDDFSVLGVQLTPTGTWGTTNYFVAATKWTKVASQTFPASAFGYGWIESTLNPLNLRGVFNNGANPSPGEVQNTVITAVVSGTDYLPSLGSSWWAQVTYVTINAQGGALAGPIFGLMNGVGNVGYVCGVGAEQGLAVSKIVLFQNGVETFIGSFTFPTLGDTYRFELGRVPTKQLRVYRNGVLDQTFSWSVEPTQRIGMAGLLRTGHVNQAYTDYKFSAFAAGVLETYILIGREQLDAIVDYSEHLALFKVGGAEFDATKQQADNFMLQALTYNQRIAAAAREVIAPKQSSQREKSERPRRLDADGIGTLPSRRQ